MTPKRDTELGVGVDSGETKYKLDIEAMKFSWSPGTTSYELMCRRAVGLLH